jgi:glucokinase
MTWLLGLDLGGTEVKCGAFSTAGQWLARRIVPTRDGETVDGRPAFVAEARRALAELAAEVGGPPTDIGVAAPGLASRDGRRIRFMPGRLHGLEDLDWAEALGRERPVPVLNDAHAALMGEVWQGAARGRRDVVMLTLGTGVGGAILSGGRLLVGHLGRAGHLGHLTVDHHGPPTITGTPGGIEVAIGNATLAARTGGKFSMTRDLAAAAQAGDRFANDIWLESVHALAAHLAGVICALDPEVIVIGGGLAELDDFLFLPLSRFLDAMEWRPGGDRVAIVKAGLGSWAGAYGAAFHALASAH